MEKLKWNQPELVPVVKIGDEKELWVAVRANRPNPHPDTEQVKIITFLAQYQNRPYEDNEDYEDDDEALVNVDGEYVNSVGWVTCQSHCDFDNYYTPITFSESYELLGWAEYTPPVFPSK